MLKTCDIVSNYQKSSKDKYYTPFLFPDLIPDIKNDQTLQDDNSTVIPISKIENIFIKPQINLNESFEEENDDSIYFIKKQDTSDIESRTTDNSTNNSIFDQDKIFEVKKEDATQKKINFKIFLRKKRGKKSKLIKRDIKKCHNFDDFDNIQRKIQVHFMNFLISLANDRIGHFFCKKNKYNFKSIKYDLKKIVNHRTVEYLKQCKYSDIIQMKISPKNKRFNENNNKNIYLKLIQLSDELKTFFDKKYLYIFQKYYLELKPNQKEINFEGTKFSLSGKTKGFYHLLEKNSVSKDKFNNIINDVYFSDINYLNDKKFLTTNLLK